MNYYCRNCEIQRKFELTTSCEIKHNKFDCLICNGKDNFKYHKAEYSANVLTILECNYCDNYIKMIDKNSKDVIDELYFHDMKVINDYLANKTIIGFGDDNLSILTVYSRENMLILPLIRFTNKADFLIKVNSLKIFL